MTSFNIPAISPVIRYIGNGSQTVFSFPFAIFQAGDLSVSLNGAVQASGFTVTGAGQTAGGSVTFNIAPGNNVIILLERKLTLQRISDFLEGGELSASSLNGEFDYLAACLQQLQQAMQPMLRFATQEEPDSVVLPDAPARANKVLGFDSQGELALVETASTYASPSVTQTGTGAVARPVANKLRDAVSVLDFGAVGDGVSDDTTALQNAITAHKCVFVPPGTYRVTSSIEIGDGKILCGSGNTSIIKATSQTFETIRVIGAYGALKDLCIDGGTIGLRLYGKTSACHGNLIHNIVIQNTVTGITLDGYNNVSYPCEQNSLIHIAIKGPTLHGVHLTCTGAGLPPNANRLQHVRVLSGATSMTGSGFYIEAARYHNMLLSCMTNISSSAATCFRIGAQSEKTILANPYAAASGSVTGVQLDSGSVDTILSNLYVISGGTVLQDNSSGSYTALNAGAIEKNLLARTRITDLTVQQQRFTSQTIALASTGTVTIDLSKSTYFVDATNAVTTMQLPLAAAGNNGAVIFIKKTDASANGVLVTENTGNGPDAKTWRIGGKNDAVCVMSDGTAWRILHTTQPTQNTASISGVTLYKPDITIRLHLVGAGASPCTVELPPANAATSVGRIVTVKKTDASAVAVRVSEEGATGPDAALQSMTTRYHTVTVMSDGTAWHVIGRST